MEELAAIVNDEDRLKVYLRIKIEQFRSFIPYYSNGACDHI